MSAAPPACPPYTLFSRFHSSSEDELFVSSGCWSNGAKTGVFSSLLALFLVQLVIAILVTLREWLFFGPSQGAVVLIFICITYLGFILIQLSFLFHFGIIFNVLAIAIVFGLVITFSTTVLYSWYRAVVNIHLIRASEAKGKLLTILKRSYFSFILSFNCVLLALWGCGLIALNIEGNVVRFNLLIASGMLWVAFYFFVISYSHVFVGKKLLQIFQLQIQDNPDQLAYRPESVHLRVSLYSQYQCAVFTLSGFAWLGASIWGFATASGHPESLGRFFFVYNLAFNLLASLVLAGVLCVIANQERHAAFSTPSSSNLSKQSFSTNSFRRESAESQTSPPTRRGSIEDSLIPGLGRKPSVVAKVFLPVIDEHSTNTIDRKLDTFLGSLSPPTTPTMTEGAKATFFELLKLGDEENRLRRQSQPNLSKEDL